MNRINTKLLIVVAVISVLATLAAVAILAPERITTTNSTDKSEHSEEIAERGPHGGRMLREAGFAAELVIAEGGVPPEFHIYAYENGKQLDTSQFSASVELERLGGIRDAFEFIPEGEYLRGLGVVREPHSFDVSVTVTYSNEPRHWQYESYEGRTEITERIAVESGIKVEPAGPQTIVETVELTGTVQANPARVSEVRARFSGVVTKVLKDSGDRVSRGETLGFVETNESLRSVPIEAPISGLLVNRNIQVGQVTGSEPLFVIADLTEVWVQLDVFGRTLGAIEAGQDVTITSLHGATYSGTIDWVSPLVAHGSQSVRARVPLDNSDGRLRAGQFVRAQVIVREAGVPLAVRRSALQSFRDFTVVYAQVGDTYEVRMLKLGRKDEEFVEVLGGLSPGEMYVTENSYLVKADIEKSGASHDH